jgi:hypothetical protein
MTNPYLSETTAAGTASDVAVEWDRGNDQWWDWYMSLAVASAPDGPLVEVAPFVPGPLATDDEVAAELAEPYPIAASQVEDFRRDSFVKLPGVLSPGAVGRLRTRLRAMLDAAVDPSVGFQSLEMMWLDDALVRAAVLSPRIGGISAALLGAERVRLYHDNALSKEPGAGRREPHHRAAHGARHHLLRRRRPRGPRPDHGQRGLAQVRPGCRARPGGGEPPQPGARRGTVLSSGACSASPAARAVSRS